MSIDFEQFAHDILELTSKADILDDRVARLEDILGSILFNINMGNLEGTATEEVRKQIISELS